MSLINDALKRAEKSLNNNSPDQKREQIPSFDFEPSGKNKRLFFVVLLGGTLFFTILIALLMLLRSPSQPHLATTPAITPPTPSFFSEILVNENEIPDEITQPIDHLEEPNQPKNERMSTAELEETPPSNPVQASTTDNLTTNEPQKAINEELFQGMVNLASRAFTGSTSSNKELKQAQKETPKADYSLSTAQETLDMLERETQNSKKLNSPTSPIQNFVDNLMITGVMIAGKESQVLINNQVYSKNSVVDPSLDLKLLDIRSHKIILQDSAGKIYTKEF